MALPGFVGSESHTNGTPISNQNATKRAQARGPCNVLLPLVFVISNICPLAWSWWMVDSPPLLDWDVFFSFQKSNGVGRKPTGSFVVKYDCCASISPHTTMYMSISPSYVRGYNPKNLLAPVAPLHSRSLLVDEWLLGGLLNAKKEEGECTCLSVHAWVVISGVGSLTMILQTHASLACLAWNN
jgi:hypothetical protein